MAHFSYILIKAIQILKDSSNVYIFWDSALGALSPHLHWAGFLIIVPTQGQGK